MTEYRWYFGKGTDEWLKLRAGTYPEIFWNAFCHTPSIETAFIYDEYGNLLYVISNLDALYNRLNSHIRKKFKLKSSSSYLDDYSLFDHLDHLNIRNSVKFEAAVHYVERKMIEHAKKQQKRKAP